MENLLLCVGNLLTTTESLRSRLVEHRVLDKIVIAKFHSFTSNHKLCSHLLWMVTNYLEKRFVVTDTVIFSMLEKTFAALAKFPSRQNIEEALYIVFFSLTRKGKTAEKIDCLVQLGGIKLCLHYFTQHVGLEATKHVGVCLCICKAVAEAGYFEDFPANFAEVRPAHQVLIEQLLFGAKRADLRVSACSVLTSLLRADRRYGFIDQVGRELDRVLQLLFEKDEQLSIEVYVLLHDFLVSVELEHSSDFIVSHLSVRVAHQLVDFMLESLTFDADADLLEAVLTVLGGFLDTGRILEEEQSHKTNIVVEHALKTHSLDNLEHLQGHPLPKVKEKVLELIKEYFS